MLEENTERTEQGKITLFCWTVTEKRKEKKRSFQLLNLEGNTSLQGFR